VSPAADALDHAAAAAARRALPAVTAAAAPTIGALVLAGGRLLGRDLVAGRHVFAIGAFHELVIPGNAGI